MKAANEKLAGLRMIRIVLAVLIFIHGAARLLTDGVAPFGEFLAAQGIPFGHSVAWFVTGFELSASWALLLGRMVTAVSLIFAIIYACGIWLVHWPAGWFVVGLGRNGMEYSVLIITCLLALAWGHRREFF